MGSATGMYRIIGGVVLGIALATWTPCDLLAQGPEPRARTGGPYQRDRFAASAWAGEPLPRSPRIAMVAVAEQGTAQACPLGWPRWLEAPATAVVLFALPVAGIAALAAEESARAAKGAVIGGTVYAAGATVALALMPRCSSTSGLIYIWTPLPAIAGAVIATS